tara:strand:- start:8788 stop:9600 length:813 start_codon:yes stop_codon:yes gene_type:complete
MNDKNKKYAVLLSPTANVGDDIQTLAAINFLKKKGITEYHFVNREKLNEYDGEEVNLVMNGWFLHETENFPPTDKIKPIWLSFHVARPQIVPANVEYFKNQPPIGCRDQATVDLLQKNGINAYFTGCLTLFFDKHADKGCKKYLVDVNTEVEYIPNVKINMKLFKDFEVVKHEIMEDGDTDIENRLLIASKLLDKYKNASLVVTTRLHCALPCRSLGTDCIFIHKEFATDPRFKGLEGVLNGATRYNPNNTSPAKGELEKIQKFFKSYKI